MKFIVRKSVVWEMEESDDMEKKWTRDRDIASFRKREQRNGRDTETCRVFGRGNKEGQGFFRRHFGEIGRGSKEGERWVKGSFDVTSE